MKFLAQKKILCVDDSEGVGKALASFFVAGKCQVDKVAGISQALLLLEKKTYDLILCSDHVPEMPEVHFLRIVRKRFPGTINILITDEAEAGLPAGCPVTAVDLILTRPFSGAEFEGRLADWLAERQRGAEEVEAACHAAGQEMDEETGGKNMDVRKEAPERVRALDEELVEEDEGQKDKYLTFRLAGEDYGVEIRYVIEIIGIQHIVEVPDMPDFVKGVINLRDRIIPVLDIRARFKMAVREYDERTCIIVVEINKGLIGLVVDEVRDVAVISEKQIEPAPQLGSHEAGRRYIKGMGKQDGRITILLDVGQLLDDEEREELDRAA